MSIETSSNDSINSGAQCEVTRSIADARIKIVTAKSLAKCNDDGVNENVSDSTHESPRNFHRPQNGN